MMFLRRVLIAAAISCAATTSGNAYQSAVDQADPSVVREELRQEDPAQPRRTAPMAITRPQAGNSAIRGDIVVGAIRVEGATALPPSAFAAVIESFVGRMLSGHELALLASEVANVARASGFGLATAWIPQQRIDNGVLRIILDEGRIDGIEVIGTGAEAIRPYLASLAGTQPVATAALERQLVLASDIPGIRMGKPRLERRNGRNILTVRAVRDRVRGYASIDNWGSSTVGPVRARITADINGVFAQDDRLTVAAVVTPAQPQEFVLGSAAYSKVIGTSGTEMNLGGYLAVSKPGGVLRDRDIEGTSSEFEFGARHPFIRTREASLWGSFDFRLRDSSQSRRDVTIRDDRIVTVAPGLMAIHRTENSRARARISLVRGLSILGATREGDPLGSRFDGSGVFTKLEFWGEYNRQLGQGFSFMAQAEAQVADRPLLSSEETGLGGRYFGRAWDYREFSGDKGIAGALELRFDLRKWPKPVTGAQLYTYVDGGSVGNYRDGFGGGSLASAGGGIRVWLSGAIEASLEAGFPLSDGANPAGDRDPRISFTLSSRF